MRKITLLAMIFAGLLIAEAQTPTPLAQFKFEATTGNTGSDVEYEANLQPEGYTEVYDYDDFREGVAAINLDGNYYYNLLDPASSHGLGAFSIATWIKPDASTLTGFHSILEKDNNFRMAIENGGSGPHIHFVVATENLGWYELGKLLSKTEITTEWVHVITVFDGSKFLIYINGVLDIEWDVEAAVGSPLGVTPATSHGLTMGDHKYNGLIDDLQFFNVALDASQVSTLFASYGFLSVDKFDISSDINLYPNPAPNNISLTNIEANSKIEIFSISGQAIYNTISKNDRLKIDVSNLSNGIYFLTIENETSKGTKKFIVSN